jgi:hypothetical protein
MSTAEKGGGGLFSGGYGTCVTGSQGIEEEPARAKCLTDDSVLEEMKSKIKEKEEEKRAKALEIRELR